MMRKYIIGIRSSQFQYFILVSSIATIALYFRLGDLSFVSKSLWAEDGTVFINQAHELGIEALWTPYAGYIHLYPRIIALLAERCCLSLTPFVFFVGWLMAFYALVWVVLDRVDVFRHWMPISFIVITLIVLQPTSGEVYFTLTNAQWFLGAAYIIILLVPSKNIGKYYFGNHSSYIVLPIVVLLGLTGPFSILALPGILITAAKNGLKGRQSVYIVASLCALLQLLVIINSDRINPVKIDPDIHHWFKAIKVFFTFGMSRYLLIAIALLFWVYFIYSLIKEYKQTKINFYSTNESGLVIVAMAFLIYFAGLYATRSMPHAINPLLNGSRYFFIPYTFITLSVGLMSFSKARVQYILMSFLAILYISSFNQFYRAELQYRAYVKFSEVKSDLAIPINPVWAVYPGWYVKPYTPSQNFEKTNIDSIKTEALDLSKIEIINSSAQFQNGVLVLSSENTDPQLMFDTTQACYGSRFVGVDVNIYRESQGWAQIFWSETGAYSEQNSLRRFFPEGKISMYFAFKNTNSGFKLRFDPIEIAEKIRINSINIYCLD